MNINLQYDDDKDVLVENADVKVLPVMVKSFVYWRDCSETKSHKNVVSRDKAVAEQKTTYHLPNIPFSLGK